MIIREATLKDIEQLSKLFDQYRIFYKKESDLAGAKSFLIQRMLNKESIIVVAEDKTLVGFIQLYPLFSSTRMKRLWMLNDLYVEPKQRGKGISVKLINWAKEWARETNAVGLILETAKTNGIGNQLYPKTDFVLDEDHNYYSWDCKENSLIL